MNRKHRNFLIAAIVAALVLAAGCWYARGGYLDNLFGWATGAEAEDVLGE